MLITVYSVQSGAGLGILVCELPLFPFHQPFGTTNPILEKCGFIGVLSASPVSPLEIPPIPLVFDEVEVPTQNGEDFILRCNASTNNLRYILSMWHRGIIFERVRGLQTIGFGKPFQAWVKFPDPDDKFRKFPENQTVWSTCSILSGKLFMCPRARKIDLGVPYPDLNQICFSFF